MKKPLQPLLAAAFVASATLAVAQQPGTTIPNTTHPSHETNNTAAGAYLHRSALDAPVASLATGTAGQDREAAKNLVEALNMDASLRGSKLTVVPEKDGLLVTGVTPSLRQKAHIVNTANRQAGDGRVSHSISTEEVVIDVGTLAAGPESMIPPDQIQVAGSAQQASDTQQAGDTQAQGTQVAQGATHAQGTQPGAVAQRTPEAQQSAPLEQATQAQPATRTAQAQPATQTAQAQPTTQAAQSDPMAQARPTLAAEQPGTSPAPQAQPQQPQSALQAQLEAAHAQLDAAKAQLDAVEAQLRSRAAQGANR